MSGTQPILALAMSLLGESGKGAARDLLETTLRDLIDGKVSLAKARSVFASHAGNEKPVLRLQQIMSVDECPLPATGDLFFASGSDLRSLNPRKKARPWTEQEDTRLLAGIFRFGLDSWKAVAEFVGSGRSQAQCSQRWNRGLDPRLSRVQWSTDEDFWVRRIAIDHQLLRKDKTNTVLLEKIIVNNFGSDEFFINKAIGWSLRDYSKTDPEWVRDFIERYRNRMDKLSIREAGKYIKE